MRIHLARWTCLDLQGNIERMRRECDAAAAGGAEMVVFPELFLTGYRREVPPMRAREAFGDASAAHPETLFVFGSISEERRNRVTVWLAGHELARYDKVHLFRPNGEHGMWDPGDRYVAFVWRGLRIGMMNCNDVRFPEQARALRLKARCDLLVVPAWWPWRRDWVWRDLLRARAIENGVWVLGCAAAGSVWAGEEFAGAGNHVFDPVGEAVRTDDDHTYELDLEHAPRPVVDPVAEAVAIDRVELVQAEG